MRGLSLHLTCILLSSLLPCSAFSPIRVRLGSSKSAVPRRLFMASSDDNDAKKRAEKARLEAERMEASLLVEKIDSLRKRINSQNDEDVDEETRRELSLLARRVDPKIELLGSPETETAQGDSAKAQQPSDNVRVSLESFPPLSDEERERAVACIQALPPMYQFRLRQAAVYQLKLLQPEEEVNVAMDLPKLVDQLYKIYIIAKSEKKDVSSIFPLVISGAPTDLVVDSSSSKARLMELLRNGGQSDEERKRGNVPILFAERARQRGKEKEEENRDLADVQSFVDLLSKDGNKIFATRGETVTYEGVYLIRGVSKKPNATALIEAIDERMQEWSGKDRLQCCLVNDVPDFDDEERSGVVIPPLLMITRKDLVPRTNGFILSLSTGLALLTSFIFALAVFGLNDVLSERINELIRSDDKDAIVALCNDYALQFLVPLFGIQAFHELGHFLVQIRDKLKPAWPVYFPFMTLPFMGSVTNLKESPKDLNSVFDYGFAGPFFGLIASLVSLLVGLQLTASMDLEAVKQLPQLPVGVLQLSTLGGAIVEAYKGETGFLLQQDASAGVPMHPIAIAGFVSLMINALDLIPTGTSDGGRIALAVYGRNLHGTAFIISVVLMLLAILFVPRHEVFLGYLAINFFAMRDLEVPCRNEVDALDFNKALMAFTSWFFAAAVLLPITERMPVQ